MSGDGRKAWLGRHKSAFALRLAIRTVPFLVVVFGLLWLNRRVGTPPSLSFAILQWIAPSSPALAVLIVLYWVTRRLLPLALLLQLSLAFPDVAPSRFRTSMRRNTHPSTAARPRRGEARGHHPQQAAEYLLVLVAALSRHDRMTRGHSERVRAYCDMVGAELGLSAEDRSKLQWAAPAHDVGKLRVDPAILNKSGKPTEAEWEELKTHADEGWMYIAPLRPWLGEWALAVRDHHEHWDGGGYPRGLSGAQISRGGRIVAVVDSFDATTSRRSYKDAMPVTEARAELVRCAGSQFDEETVRRS